MAGSDVQMGASGDMLEVKAQLTGIPCPASICGGVSDDEQDLWVPWNTLEGILELLWYLGVA